MYVMGAFFLFVLNAIVYFFLSLFYILLFFSLQKINWDFTKN